MFISLDKEQGHAIRSKLLETLVSETDKAVRNKISDAVAELARQYYDSSSFSRSEFSVNSILTCL